jgi:uncharacterized membrane protein
MSQAENPAGPFQLLQQLTIVVLLFQAVFLLTHDGRMSGAMTGILAATVVHYAVNRRMIAAPQGRHATFYVALWKYGVLALLAVITVVAAVDAYAPAAIPDGMPTLIAMLLPSVIALKGAALGKLKPNGLLGLRLSWTRQSKLAWEQAHRLMGRILFFGGLIGLVAAPFVPIAATFVGIAVVVLTGVIAGAIKARRVWQSDPERSI